MSELISEITGRLEDSLDSVPRAGNKTGRQKYAIFLDALSENVGVTLEYRDLAMDEVRVDGSYPELQKDISDVRTIVQENPVIFDRLYANLVNRKDRRAKGQFFTPEPVAKFMAELLSSKSDILDPAVGPGIFGQTCLQQCEPSMMLLNDLDPIMLFATELRLELSGSSTKPIRLSNKNFLTTDLDRKFDGVICNPPYNKFQSHDNGIIPEFEERFGVELGGFSNIYPLFLIKSVEYVMEGRIVFITPSEYLDTGFGTDLKRFMLDHVDTKAIISLEWDSAVFDALTTATITILDTGGQTDEVAFIKSDDPTDLPKLSNSFPDVPDEVSVQYHSADELEPSDKWSRYFQKSIDTKFLDATVPLSSLANTKRGIATGCNEFFTLSKDEIEKWNIEDRYLRPVLAKANQAPGYKFTTENHTVLRQSGKNVFLLYITEEPSEAVREYLEHGKSEFEAHERYLTSHRNPWYEPERRQPAPILATVFSRDNMRFVYNEARVLNLAAFHGIYPNFKDESRVKALAGYLNSDPALELTTLKKRRYADGLEKFEPGDLSEVPILDIRRLSDAEINRLNELFDQLCEIASESDSGTKKGPRVELNQFVRDLLDSHRNLKKKESITAWSESWEQ